MVAMKFFFRECCEKKMLGISELNGKKKKIKGDIFIPFWL